METRREGMTPETQFVSASDGIGGHMVTADAVSVRYCVFSSAGIFT
jgi:hypothetical protein